MRGRGLPRELTVPQALAGWEGSRSRPGIPASMAERVSLFQYKTQKLCQAWARIKGVARRVFA